MMVFSRHRGNEGNTHPDQIKMLDLNDVSFEIAFTSFFYGNGRKWH